MEERCFCNTPEAGPAGVVSFRIGGFIAPLSKEVASVSNACKNIIQIFCKSISLTFSKMAPISVKSLTGNILCVVKISMLNGTTPILKSLSS